jgi:alpha-L-arabinofuranosidase
MALKVEARGCEGPMRKQQISRRGFMERLVKAGLAGMGEQIVMLGHTDPTVQRASGEQPLQAKIKLDIDRRLGTVDPNIYGGFIEQMGRCIYGGIYDEGSPLSDADGNRKDVLDALRRLRVTQLRWPGGNFASDYHWQDGIGPKDSRPMRYNLVWYQHESDRFGTDEFISTCRKVGAEPYLCVNMGTGSLDEAAAWVEYCNGETGTYYSDLRKKNGHADPYGVKFWALGNEMYGDWQIGHKDAASYSQAAVEFAKVMKRVDPRIQLVACGDEGDPEWDLPVLEALVHHVDYVAAHYYAEVAELREYYEVLGSVAALEGTLRVAAYTAEMVSARARRRPPIGVALDEWNIMHNFNDSSKRGDGPKHEFSYNLRDTLWVASALNAIQRHCRSVRIANLAQMVNVAAPVWTTETGILLRTIYYPLELYFSRSGRIALDVLTDSPNFATKYFSGQPYLDVAATYDEEKSRVALSVVNRRKEGDIIGSVVLEGVRAKPGGRAFLISGPAPETQNTLQDAHAVSTQEIPFNISGDRWEYRFPRHSILWFEFEVAGS